MRFWQTMMAMLMIACLALVPVGCDDGEDPGGDVSLEGVWLLAYAWNNGSPAGSTPHVQLYGQQSGTCMVNGHNGTWSYDGGTFEMTLFSPEGIAEFTGTLNDGTEIAGTVQSAESGAGSFVMTRVE